ncbi:ankyrin repeat-containing domain protein [Fusarium oxysporum f. sp. albedinis]|nr:ankyrin repeat-containing domain protein [Fusarium oxysporum f. sp. albedinis]
MTMSSSTDTEDEPPYYRFTENPNAEYKSQGLKRPWPVPMAIPHSDGSILYEKPTFSLLYTIIQQNDTKALQQYLTIAPWAVSIEPVFANDLWAVPDRRSSSDGGASYGGMNINYLQWAAQGGGLGVFKILLHHCTKGKDPEIKIRFESQEFELLNEAAKYGQVDMVKFLLDNQPRYASIYERDSNGYTALLSAASAPNLDLPTSLQERRPGAAASEATMNLLLDRGACASDVLYGNQKIRNTVLTLTVEWAGSRLIKRLIDGFASIDTKVQRGPWDEKFWNLHDCNFEANALYVACTHANFEAVKTLIDCRGSEVDVSDVLWQRDSRGSTPLHWVTQSHLPRENFGYSKDAIYDKARNIMNIIEFLLDLDPTAINATDTDGNTPLHYATRSPSRHDKMYSPIFQLLCARGSDAGIRNTEGQTPLHTRFRLDDSGRVRYYYFGKTPIDAATLLTLLAHGASTADTDKAGNTPLHIAAANLEWDDAVSFFLRHGGDPALQNLNGQTSLHRAAAGTYLGRDQRYKAPERIRAQEEVLSRLVEAGGVELMDLADAEGMNPRQICHKTRQGWKELDGPPRRTGKGRGRGSARRIHKI